MIELNSVQISRVENSDLPELALLLEELMDEKSDILKMNELLSVIRNDKNYFLLCAKNKERILGTLIGIICYDLIGSCLPFMVIENVIVKKVGQRLGIGKKLMSAIEDIAKTNGCRYIMLISGIERLDAHPFYLRCGYKSEPYKGFKKMLIT